MHYDIHSQGKSVIRHIRDEKCAVNKMSKNLQVLRLSLQVLTVSDFQGFYLEKVLEKKRTVKYRLITTKSKVFISPTDISNVFVTVNEQYEIPMTEYISLNITSAF